MTDSKTRMQMLTPRNVRKLQMYILCLVFWRVGEFFNIEHNTCQNWLVIYGLACDSDFSLFAQKTSDLQL